MAVELKPVRYIDYKIYNVTRIKNKYGFRLILYLDDNSTRTVQHSGFDKKEKAEKERCSVIGKLENRTYTVYTDITVKKYFEYWFEFKAKNRIKSYNSYMSYRNAIFNYIIPKIGNVKLVGLTKSMIEKLYFQVKEHSSNVCRIVQTVLKSGLEDAKRDKFIPSNEAESVRIPKTKEEIEREVTTKNGDEIKYHTLVIDERKTYTVEQLITLIKASKNTPIYMHVLFAALMGFRKSEIIGIKYSDIDYIHRRIKLDRQLREKNGRQQGRL